MHVCIRVWFVNVVKCFGIVAMVMVDPIIVGSEVGQCWEEEEVLFGEGFDLDCLVVRV